MEYEAKGTLEGGTAKMYTIEDKSKINHTLQVGDYFCADGKIVSVDAETVPGECDWYCMLCRKFTTQCNTY